MSCIGIDVGYGTAGASRATSLPGAQLWAAPAAAPSLARLPADAEPARPVAVVAIARRGGIDVLANEVSKRNTAYADCP